MLPKEQQMLPVELIGTGKSAQILTGQPNGITLRIVRCPTQRLRSIFGPRSQQQCLQNGEFSRLLYVRRKFKGYVGKCKFKRAPPTFLGASMALADATGV